MREISVSFCFDLTLNSQQNHIPGNVLQQAISQIAERMVSQIKNVHGLKMDSDQILRITTTKPEAVDG
ncbi:MAG TPA: hypothetical protein VHO70_15915 [Chitinispirillaceae bacterium]|nr:hypothetical protein [Chitinispirillaceae bacterium]